MAGVFVKRSRPTTKTSPSTRNPTRHHPRHDHETGLDGELQRQGRGPGRHEVVAQHNHKGSDSHLQPPIDVFHDRRRNTTQDNNTLEPEQPVEFRKTAGAFNKSYDFFSQVIDYGSTRIEKFAIYLKLLAKALQTTATGNSLDLSDAALTHYALRCKKHRT